MFVPILPRTKIINKTIVYSDTVLPLKESGENIKISSISNIDEKSLEDCLKTIIESNSDVVFNTIQYSKNNKKIYFYTDKTISMQAWNEKQFFHYKPITSRTEILEEVKNVLLSPKNKDYNCISLYDVLMLLKKYNNEYKSMIHKYKDKLDDIAERIIKDSIVEFDYLKNTLRLSIKINNYSDWKEIYFSKENEDLYVVKSETYYTNEILSALGPTLSEMYDELIKYRDYKDFTYSKFDIKPVNSNFEVEITYNGIKISINTISKEILNEFKLYAPSYMKGYELECNSNIIHEALKDNKDEIFKKIFVKIEDCPEWSKKQLHQIRDKQLTEENRIEEERLNIEMQKQRIKEEERLREERKKQRRLEFKRKFFPWLNN